MSEESASLPWLPFLVILLIGVPIVIWMARLRDGWQLLLPRYRATQPASGKSWNFQSGVIGWGEYRNGLTLTANADGLYVEIVWFLSFGHPPLFIPWSEFHNVSIQTILVWRAVRADVGNPRVTSVQFPVVVFEESEGSKLLAVHSHVEPTG